MRCRLAFILATLAAFLALALLWLWDLLPVIRTAYLEATKDPDVLMRSDAMLTSWMLAWGSHALRTNPLGYFDANIFHPLPLTFAFSESLPASALLITPVDLLWRNPVLDHNVFLVASFVLAGTGTALLVRELDGGLPAAWLAGAIVAFDPFRFGTIGHIHALSTHWMPFALLALHRCLRTGRGALLVALTVSLEALSSVYYAYFFFLAIAVFLPMHWVLRCPAAAGGRWRALAGVAVAAVVTTASRVPYAIARNVYALGRAPAEAWFFGAKAHTYLGALLDPVEYASRRYAGTDAMRIVVGPGALALAILGLATGARAERGGRRTATAHLAVAVALAIVSLGPLMQWSTLRGPGVPGVWDALARVVPGFAALRVPMRACTVVVLELGVLAGLGADAIWRRARRPAARAALLVVFVIVGIAESWHPAFGVVRVAWAQTGVPPVYRWLAAQDRPGAVVELPIGLPANDAGYMVLSATHWRPLVNGYSGFTPTTSFFRKFLETFPDTPTIRLLHELDVRWVVVHPADLPRAQARLCATNPSGLAPYVVVAYRDASSCVFEVTSAPPPPATPPDRPVSLVDARLTTATGADVSALLDGGAGAHWVEPANEASTSWLQLDLPVAHPVSRVVVELGPHFGEYLREWRIETSADGNTWELAASDRNAVPPLVQMRTDASALSTELRIDPPAMTYHLRIVRPGGDKYPQPDLWMNWKYWGIQGLRVFEAAP